MVEQFELLRTLTRNMDNDTLDIVLGNLVVEQDKVDQFISDTEKDLADLRVIRNDLNAQINYLYDKLQQAEFYCVDCCIVYDYPHGEPINDEAAEFAGLSSRRCCCGVIEERRAGVNTSLIDDEL